MTALVSVMNKHAVAVAADSAVTITNSYGHKVINGTNKLFTLSKYNPVGMMFCGDCNFMGTPWEVIIKLYRDKLHDDRFETIEDYKNDFIKFLKEHNMFCSEKKQRFLLQVEMFKFYNIMKNITNNVIGKDQDLYIDEFSNQLNRIIADKSDTCSGLTPFDEKKIKNYCKDLLNDFYEEKKDVFKLNDKLKSLYKEAFINFIRKNNSNIDSSQLIFVGYGEKEIFPSLRSITIYFGFNNKILRYHPYIEQQITEDNDAAISRFGQIDVINTVINGINPVVQDAVNNIFVDYSRDLISLIESLITDDNAKKALKSIDVNNQFNIFKNKLQVVIQEKFTSPLVNSISYLDKEDMAELVESLISITHLNRRITTSEEGVGGPIDVAVISKSDGFIWKKRKHYFEPELNKPFFDNYFSKK